MNAEKGEGRIWDRIDVAPDELGLFGWEEEVLPSEGDDFRLGGASRQDWDPVRLEARAGQHVAAVDLLTIVFPPDLRNQNRIVIGIKNF